MKYKDIKNSTFFDTKKYFFFVLSKDVKEVRVISYNKDENLIDFMVYSWFYWYSFNPFGDELIFINEKEGSHKMIKYLFKAKDIYGL